ncbi:MAG: ACP phosphodiesterase, partial [Bacteroidia bacterium]
KQRLYPKYHKYSTVIIDIFYDHFLATDFQKYSEENLLNFSQRCYAILGKNIHLMPQRVQFFLPYMIRHNWLHGYAEIEGIGRALAGLASRARFTSNMQTSVYDLIEHYKPFKKEFDEFFPELKKYSEEFLMKVNA